MKANDGAVDGLAHDLTRVLMAYPDRLTVSEISWPLTWVAYNGFYAEHQHHPPANDLKLRVGFEDDIVTVKREDKE
jgi:hypothetical protein